MASLPLRSRATLIGVGLAYEWFKPTQPVTPAEAANSVAIKGRVAAEQFDNIGFGLHSACIQLQPDEMGERNDSEPSGRPGREGGLRQARVDDCRKTLAKVHNLNKPELSMDVDHSAKWIVSVWLSVGHIKRCGPQHFGHLRKIADSNIHGEIDVFCVTNIAVGGHCRRADHDRWIPCLSSRSAIRSVASSRSGGRGILIVRGGAGEQPSKSFFQTDRQSNPLLN